LVVGQLPGSWKSKISLMLPSYMEYIESIGFTPKILNFVFAQRLCLNSSFIDSPRLKVKILLVGKTLFKSKIHQISKFWTFSEKNCDHKHHQL
jgi:hypothetical protein